MHLEQEYFKSNVIFLNPTYQEAIAFTVNFTHLVKGMSGR